MPVPRGGLDAGYEQLRHAAVHARADAFPLGLAVLTRKGVTAWRRALTELTPAATTSAATFSTAPAPAGRATLPTHIATELIHALTAVALAGA